MRHFRNLFGFLQANPIKDARLISLMWQISMIALKNGNYIEYKVTRRFPEYYQSETKSFKKKSDALKQFNEWLNR